MKKVAETSQSENGSLSSTDKYDTKDMLLKLFELLQGERALIKIYSKKLRSEVFLVNPELQNPDDLSVEFPVYTTNELAFILPMNAEEFTQFHYLKTRLPNQ